MDTRVCEYIFERYIQYAREWNFNSTPFFDNRYRNIKKVGVSLTA